MQQSFPWGIDKDANIPEAEAEPSWKDSLRRNFEAWLEAVDRMPESADEEFDAPDLTSFFEQLAVSNSENRKTNRRTAEAFSRWGETLERFGADLDLFRDQFARLQPAHDDADSLPRPHCLALVEFLDRLLRMTQAFASPPAPGWWRRNDSAWRQAWEAQRGACDILAGHLRDLLAREGVARIECLGRPFDPTVMTAAAAAPDPKSPDNTVIEEFSPGYTCRGSVLRPAQVKVVNNRSTTEKS